MNKIKRILIMTTLAIGSAWGVSQLQSCKKKECPCQDPTNPECENYDPCYGKKMQESDFTFGSHFATQQSFFGNKNYIHDKDSILDINNRIMFTPTLENASYTWELGAEVIKEKTFSRVFNTVPEGWYKASLITERDRDTICFPMHNGKDTIIKRWYMMPRYKFPIMGKYKVLFKGDKDSTIVQIRPWATKLATPSPPYTFSDTQSTESVTLINFRNQQDTLIPYLFSRRAQVVSGHWIVFNDRFQTDYPGAGYVRYDGSTIKANYKISKTGQSDPYVLEFEGRKIQ